jgi:MFS family permease
LSQHQPALPEAADARTVRRVLTASLVGTAVEFYDFYIYATAASLFFGQLFFPAASPSAQLLAAYASLGLAFVARPVGAACSGITAIASGASRRWSARCC